MLAQLDAGDPTACHQGNWAASCCKIARLVKVVANECSLSTSGRLRREQLEKEGPETPSFPWGATEHESHTGALGVLAICATARCTDERRATAAVDSRLARDSPDTVWTIRQSHPRRILQTPSAECSAASITTTPPPDARTPPNASLAARSRTRSRDTRLRQRAP